jgi:uncharacterized protein YgbK (DUF1537 family)
MQSKHRIGYISLGTVMQGRGEIKKEVQKQSKDCRVIVVDARTDEDIREIAKGCIDSKLKFTSVDPGPFSGSVIHELYANDQLQGKEIKRFSARSEVLRLSRENRLRSCKIRGPHILSK